MLVCTRVAALEASGRVVAADLSMTRHRRRIPKVLVALQKQWPLEVGSYQT